MPWTFFECCYIRCLKGKGLFFYRKYFSSILFFLGFLLFLYSDSLKEELSYSNVVEGNLAQKLLILEMEIIPSGSCGSIALLLVVKWILELYFHMFCFHYSWVLFSIKGEFHTCILFQHLYTSTHRF